MRFEMVRDLSGRSDLVILCWWKSEVGSWWFLQWKWHCKVFLIVLGVKSAPGWSSDRVGRQTVRLGGLKNAAFVMIGAEVFEMFDDL